MSGTPHVVIVGAGFGGLQAARRLRRAPLRITLVDRRNYHLFQPLLYQVATAGLTPEDISYPVRAIFRRQRNLSFRLAEVFSIDREGRRLETSAGPIPYDWLILAPGGASNFFGLDSVARHGLAMKEVEDAVAIRNQVLRMFELGVQEEDPDRRRAMLTFVVVGGGPTGVESAGALSELCRVVLARDHPALDVKDLRIVLLEATDRLLGPMPKRLREATAEILWRKHVEVRFGARVTHFDGECVALQGGERIPARTLIWAAGVRAAELVSGLGAPLGPLGRVAVRETLQIEGDDRVFVVGDAAHREDPEGRPLPMMAPVAQQQGRLAADNVVRLARGEAPRPFRYRDPGSMATIGRGAAVFHVGGIQWSGFLAWLAWLLLHIVHLIGFRNRIVVLVNWAWDYFFYERSVRLIHAHEIHTAPRDADAEVAAVAASPGRR